ncbi:hypothetical protein D8Y23_02535 [Microbacterium enclense]|uniref:Uncharacterized protein n=1 Tax=Microbacterium enclense TaxID=993073 RepID=A0A3S3N159_9MICO|nr:hypothetical protein [Microbacterium enclense]RWR22231.1 hypothetical protein D8Y23_02535 [Microbacterium enclense]
MDNTIPTQGVTRRSFTTALAWSVPVVAVAVAAPSASASGALAASAYDISEVEVGDSFPLSIDVTEGGTPLDDGTVVTVSLTNTAVLEFDPDADGFVTSTIASVPIVGGVANAIVLVRAFGTTTGAVAYGSSQATYVVGVTQA